MQSAGKRVSAIGSGFTSDWLKKWCEPFKPIALRGNVKPRQMRLK